MAINFCVSPSRQLFQGTFLGKLQLFQTTFTTRCNFLAQRCSLDMLFRCPHYDKLIYDNLVYIIRKGRRKVNPWGEFFSPVFQQENKWKLLEIQYNKRDYDKSVYTTRNKGDVLRLLEEKTGSRPTPAACFLLLDRKSGRMPFIAPVLRFLAGSGHLHPAHPP